MSEDFDLFGNRVRAGHGRRGRPPFEVTPDKLNKIKLGLALGWSNERLANGLACSLATLKRYFRAELAERDMARDQLELRRFELVMSEANKGNVGAIKELGRMIERNDQMEAGRKFSQAQDRPRAVKEKPLGKKEAAQRDAETAGGEGSLWGGDLTPGYIRPN